MLFGQCAHIYTTILSANAVVGAGAVVTHDVPEYAVVAGIPAQVVKTIEPHA